MASSSKIDSTTSVTIDQMHHMIHLGKLFEASGYFAAVADTANLDVLVQTHVSPDRHSQQVLGSNQ